MRTFKLVAQRIMDGFETTIAEDDALLKDPSLTMNQVCCACNLAKLKAKSLNGSHSRSCSFVSIMFAMPAQLRDCSSWRKACGRVLHCARRHVLAAAAAVVVATQKSGSANQRSPRRGPFRSIYCQCRHSARENAAVTRPNGDSAETRPLPQMYWLRELLCCWSIAFFALYFSNCFIALFCDTIFLPKLAARCRLL